MKWTDEQRRAIEAPGSLLVSAAAGSGKTAVLTERIARLVAGGCPLDRFLVVTFTRAAAAEMKKRVASRLSGLAQGAAPAEAARLSAAAASVGQANISTIDAFCAHVLRRHFHAAGLDPAFRAADEAQAEALQQEVWEEVLEEGYAEGGLDGLAALFGTEEAFLASARRLYDFLCAQPDMEGWLGRAAAAYGVDGEALAASPQMEAFLQAAAGRVAARVEALDALRAGIAADYPAAAQVLDGELSQLRALLLPHTYQSFGAQLQSLSFGRLVWPRGTPEEAKAPVAAARNGAKEEVKGLLRAFQPSLTQQAERLRALAPHMERLKELLLSFHRRYGARKGEAGLVDYADMEHMALELLARPAVAAEYRGRFEHVFVDEYQDISPVQERIIQAVSRGDNLFLVGDVKQSIYGFRMAEPGLFLGKQAAYRQGRGGLCIDLNANFRSGAAVIAAVNGLFSQVMGPAAGGVAYDQSAALRQGRTGLGGGAELHLIRQQALLEPEAEDLEPGEDAVALLEAAEAEARLAARRIRALLGQAGPEGKPLRYRDMVVLHSAPRRVAELWVQTLAREGVPAYAELTGGYFDAVEVQVLLNLLRLLDNRRQDIPLVSVLRSPIGGMSTEELIELRAGRQGEGFFESLCKAAAYDTPLGRKAAGFLEKLGRWREKAALLGLPQLIALLLEETGYGRYVRALPGGAARRGNLEALLQSAESWSETGHGLAGFLRFMDRIRETGRMGAAQVGGADVVRVLSIHKSKGLEFPVVFLAGLNKGFNLTDSQAPLVMDAALGLGVKPVVKNARQRTLYHSAIAARTAERAVAEQMRVLYVAMTRAEERLILLCALPDPASALQKARAPLSPARSLSARRYADWVLPAVFNGPEGSLLRSLLGLGPVSGRPGTGLACVLHEWAGPGEGGAALDPAEYRAFAKAARQASPDPALTARLSWAYPYPAETRLPSKVTVSALIGNPPALARCPAFLREARPLTPVERGAAAHLVMEHIPLQAHTPASVRETLDSLQGRGLLTAAQREAVYAPAIAAFFQSPLGQRLAAAHRVERELAFSCRIPARRLGLGDSAEPVLLQGVVDCCFLEKGAWVLLDYKTDYVQEGGAEAAALGHEPQLRLYSLALGEVTGLSVAETYIVLLRTGEAVRIG